MSKSGDARQHSASNQVANESGLHLIFLAMSIVVLLLSFTLSVEGQTRVVVPMANLALPHMCVYRQILGLDCPGCGLTRSFISIAHGKLGAAWNYNPAGIGLFAFVLAQVPYRITQLWRIRGGFSPLYWPKVNWLLWGILFVLLVQWVVRTIGAVS